ncbi:MAG TPA: hypothetical protein ENN36_01030 [Candidatus Bathyarchaeota archaeon]|nr:hypothetical protein [Candidatus Bathyarchaeota archaeon]
MAGRKSCAVRLSVFKGKEAKRNRMVFQVLAEKSPQTAWKMFKELKKQKGLTKLDYGVLIDRINDLYESDYLMKVGETKTMPGTETGLYQLTPRAELAVILDKTDLDKFVKTADYHRIFMALEAFQNPKQ